MFANNCLIACTADKNNNQLGFCPPNKCISNIHSHFSSVLVSTIWLFSCYMLHYVHQLAASFICQLSLLVGRWHTYITPHQLPDAAGNKVWEIRDCLLGNQTKTKRVKRLSGPVELRRTAELADNFLWVFTPRNTLHIVVIWFIVNIKIRNRAAECAHNLPRQQNKTKQDHILHYIGILLSTLHEFTLQTVESTLQRLFFLFHTGMRQHLWNWYNLDVFLKFASANLNLP